MSTRQCPVCFSELEVRRVQPCFVCGGWPGATPAIPEHHLAVRDDGTPLTLCNVCWVEEVLSNQGDLKERLKIRGERDLVVTPQRPGSDTDKFCPSCNRRLVLLAAMARRLSDEELERWRR